MIWWQSPWSSCNKRVHHCQKVTVVVKARVENALLWYKHKLSDVYAIHWYKLHQWLSAAAHVTHTHTHTHTRTTLFHHKLIAEVVTLQSSTSSIRWHHGSFSEHCCIFPHFIVIGFSPDSWAVKVTSYLAKWIVKSHMQYAIEIGSNCDFKFHKVV